MDWLKGMNHVLEFIEANLSQPIQYESLSKIVGCSVYEFSRIFSFMAGMPGLGIYSAQTIIPSCI
jgi:AraC family transcriptional regulator